MTNNSVNKCLLCLSENIYNNLKIKDRVYYKCRNCGIIFHNKILTDLTSIYNSESYFIKETSPAEGQFGYNDYIYYKTYLEEHFEEQLVKLEKYVKKGKLLDVGCALGFLLNVAKSRGWEVSGVDISKFAVEYARSKFNSNVFLGELEDCNFKSDYFDAITMDDFLEHIDNPKKLIKEAYRILKKNGVLMINTPNSDSLSFLFLGKNWLHIKQEDHLFIYNNKSINYLLNYFGYQILEIETNHKISDLNVISDRLGYYNKFLEKFFDKVINTMRIGKFKFKIKTGEMLIFAKK